jgi:hypothetical protein
MVRSAMEIGFITEAHSACRKLASASRRVTVLRNSLWGRNMIKLLVGSATALAIVMTAASPAAARPRWGGGWGGHGGYGSHGGYGGYRGHYRHHHGGGDTFGNILLGAVIGGGIFAIANSANKNKAVASRRGDDQRDDLRENGSDAREVAAMCSDAIENMARGRVASIDSVDRDGPGWRVDGVVDVEREGDRHFYCDVRDGRIETVQLSNREGYRRGSPRG